MTMKVSFYFDTYAHQQLKHIFPTQNPGTKIKGATRYKVTVEVPDPLDLDVDEEIQVDAVKVEGDEHSIDA